MSFPVFRILTYIVFPPLAITVSWNRFKNASFEEKRRPVTWKVQNYCWCLNRNNRRLAPFSCFASVTVDMPCNAPLQRAFCSNSDRGGERHNFPPSRGTSAWNPRGGGGGGGGHFHWRPYQMLENKPREKRVSKSGVARKSRTAKREKWYSNCSDQSLDMRLYVGRV